MRPPRSRRWIAFAVPASLAAAALVYATAAYRTLERTVAAKLDGRAWAVPSRVYTGAFALYPGLEIAGTGVLERLKRLGYREVDVVRGRGEFHRDPGGESLDVHLHAFRYPLHPETGRALRLTLDHGVVTRIGDLVTDEEVFDARLEPEPLAGLYDQVWEERSVVTLAEIPPRLVQAVLAAEDSRFFEHGAIDVRGVVRALVRNVAAGRVVEGGSTLTQQLMKNFFLTEERTWSRKARELLMAIVTERRYAKEQILEHYLNEIYLGQSGAKGIFGVAEAAQFYFGKQLSDLTIGETALLAGLIRAPNANSPFRSPMRAQARRDVVLTAMAEHGAITPQEAEAARAEPLALRPYVTDRTNAPYFVDTVRRQLQNAYPPEALTAEGLRVFTSLDGEMQAAAEAAVRDGLAELERLHPKLRRDEPEEQLEGALVAIHPATGEIKAMVGGRDYRITQFNRATDAARQPGSVFKPVVYYAAFDPDAGEPHFTPTSRLEDAAFAWTYEGRTWTPGNYKDRYRGMVTAREALEDSLNAATARLAFEIGLPRVLDAAEHLGFPGPLPALPAIVLGGLETTPLVVAEVYAVFASQGQRTTPRAITQVADERDTLIEGRPLDIASVVSPQATYLVTHVLEGAIDRGTGSAARTLGFRIPAAGKTGTTNDYGDAWFAGYTPDLVTVVWVGFDRRQSLGLSGAQAALPIWSAFMRRATAGRPARDFEVPQGIVLATVDPESGGRATAACPRTVVEAFLEADAPTADCPLHGGAALDERGTPGAGDESEPPRPKGGGLWRRWFGR
ncbi:MAG: PBP1A family penicillin-binding protein [Deltaproteobacteria bacterium]|nr:PBP1A family penicillin-binding protein [Deltaproteobacteria bacterium]